MLRKILIPGLLLAAMCTMAGITGAIGSDPGFPHNQETRGGSIGGIVLNLREEPVPGAIVVLIGRIGHEEIIRLKTRTDREGQFVFRPLRPGYYRLVAHHEDWGRGGTRLKLREDEHARVRIVLEP